LSSDTAKKTMGGEERRSGDKNALTAEKASFRRRDDQTGGFLGEGAAQENSQGDSQCDLRK
jgi:hypothetical protein